MRPTDRVLHGHVEEALLELADEDSQRRLWTSTGAGGADVSSFEECMACLFDDSGLADALERGLVYGAETDAFLRKLARLSKRMDTRRRPEELIADPLMTTMRLLARETRLRVLASATSGE
jgi:hypothetical protein